jgi:hypothetical protein
MKCVKKYKDGGVTWPGRGRRNRGGGGGVDYGSGSGRGNRLSRECKDAAEQKAAIEGGGGDSGPRSRPNPQPKVKPLKLNVVPLQPPKTGLTNPYEGMNRSEKKAAQERAKQRRHSNPRFL